MQKAEKKTILLIDDDTSLLITLSDFLKFEGYEVVTAENGEQGLKKLARIRPDLIILDMSMPGMGGVGFLKRISGAEGKPDYPVLVLTARGNMAEFFANVEVDGFVAKPCDPNDLLMEVGRIVFLRSGPAKQSGEEVRKKKVLVGEDDEKVRAEIVGAFSAAGFVADSVARGPEVIEKAIVDPPDVIAVKYLFAQLNGDAVAKMLRELPRTRKIPVVLYNDSKSQMPDEDSLRVSTSVGKIVAGNDPDAIVEAVNGMLSRTEHAAGG